MYVLQYVYRVLCLCLVSVLLYACTQPSPSKENTTSEPTTGLEKVESLCSACPKRCLLQDGKATCLECLDNKDCETSTKPLCISGKCSACEPGTVKFCHSNEPTKCGKGTQQCLSTGEWSPCQFDGEIVCKANQSCADGTCVDECPATEPKSCGRVCANLELSEAHCGGCNNACKQGQICSGGQCTCSGSLTLCDNKCVDTSESREHCGACGKTCSDGQVCANGLCTNNCPKASPTTCYGACTNTATSVQHCGRCGNACAGTKRCISGSCQCVAGLTDCAQRCVDTLTNFKHCGRCGNACKKGQVCSDGTCLLSCPASTPDTCYGGCVDHKSNAQHCGKCGNTCPVGQVCADGKCEDGCDVSGKSWKWCSRGCVDLSNNPLHCGACGNRCGGKEQCYEGQCLRVCPINLKRCGVYICVAPRSDPHHCGDCGIQCAADENCCNGTCTKSDREETCGDGKDNNCNGLVDEGCTLYNNVYGTQNKDTLTDAVLAYYNEIYVTGTFQGTMSNLAGTTITSSPTSPSAYIAKISIQEQNRWAYSLGGHSWTTAMYPRSNGDLLVVGGYDGTITFPDNTQAHGKGNFLLCMSLTGKVQWKWTQRQLGAGTLQLTDVLGDSNIGAMLIGHTNGNVLIAGKPYTKHMAFVITIDESNAIQTGIAQTKRVIPLLGNSDTNGKMTSLKATYANNTLTVAGEFTGKVQLGKHTLQSRGGKDIFFLSVKYTGTFQSLHQWGSTGDDTLSDILFIKSINNVGPWIMFAGSYHGSINIAGTTYTSTTPDAVVGVFRASTKTIRTWIGLGKNAATKRLYFDADSNSVLAAGQFIEFDHHGRTYKSMNSKQDIFLVRFFLEGAVIDLPLLQGVIQSPTQEEVRACHFTTGDNLFLGLELDGTFMYKKASYQGIGKQDVGLFIFKNLY